jgi:hypothetical protein
VHDGIITCTAGFLNIKTSTEKPRRQGQMQTDCDQSRTKCKYLRAAKLRPNQARTHDTVSICRLLGILNNRIFVVRSACTGRQFASRNESDTFLKYLEIAMMRDSSKLSLPAVDCNWMCQLPGEHMRRVRIERTASRIEDNMCKDVPGSRDESGCFLKPDRIAEHTCSPQLPEQEAGVNFQRRASESGMNKGGKQEKNH